MRGTCEEVRSALVARIPRWYVPWVHLVGPSAGGLALIGIVVSRLHHPTMLELACVPAFLVLFNGFEWALHRDVLHRRVRLLEFAFQRHTPEHHGAFDTEHMAIHDARELKLVLLPAFGVVAMFLAAIPPGLALAALVSWNVGALWIAIGVGYVIAYEWLHLVYHLPETGLVGRSRVVRALRRHHALHHAPALMQRWNFNVTAPLWDWLMGTAWQGRDVRATPEAARR